MAGRKQRLVDAIEQRFHPASMEIEDQSARHAGHAGVRDMGSGDAGETHYTMTVISAAFAGLSRVQRSRAVHEALGAEFDSGLHALSLTLRTPEEAA